MNKKTRKNLLNALFLIALIAATIWMVFRDQDLGEIVQIISQIAPEIRLGDVKKMLKNI